MGGFSGIVTDWDSQAFRLTNRVSGVRHEKFAQEREAVSAFADLARLRRDMAETLCIFVRGRLPDRV